MIVGLGEFLAVRAQVPVLHIVRRVDSLELRVFPLVEDGRCYCRATTFRKGYWAIAFRKGLLGLFTFFGEFPTDCLLDAGTFAFHCGDRVVAFAWCRHQDTVLWAIARPEVSMEELPWGVVCGGVSRLTSSASSYFQF